MKTFRTAAALALALLASPADGLGSLRHLDFRHKTLQPAGEVANRTSVAEEPAGEDKGAGQGGIPAVFRNAIDEGSSNTAKWTKDPASAGSYAFACVWVSLVALMPVMLHCVEHGRDLKMLTNTQIAETVILYIWLIGGLYLFTNVLLFQSPHFGNEIRSLSLVEAVYLFAQIVTTVGYGDITPAKTRGQVFVGLFVVLSFLLVAGMISQFATIVLERVQDAIHKQEVDAEAHPEKSEDELRSDAIWTAAGPLIGTTGVFAIFLAIGVIFFSQYPGENKTVFQAIYMSFITLSSVGFGAFTPVTKVGMVFGAFWMLFGVTSLGGVISSMGAFVKALKDYEKGHSQERKMNAVKIGRKL